MLDAASPGTTIQEQRGILPTLVSSMHCATKAFAEAIGAAAEPLAQAKAAP